MEEITTISPSSDKPILTRYGLSQNSLDTLVVNAQAAFRSYKMSHPTLISRQDIVAKALAALNVEQDALAKELTEQMGRPIAVSSTFPRILEKPLLRHISGGRLLEREPLPITLPRTLLLNLWLSCSLYCLSHSLYYSLYYLLYHLRCHSPFESTQANGVIQYTAKEITTAVMRGQYLNTIASQVLDHDVPGTEEKGFKRYIRREPVGVVLIIFAWNVRQLTYHHRDF
jgi:hypothetical protein